MPKTINNAILAIAGIFVNMAIIRNAGMRIRDHANVVGAERLNTILMVQVMSVEELGLLQLGLMLRDNIKFQVEWLARRQLLCNTDHCTCCVIVCTLVTQGDVADGFRWKC